MEHISPPATTYQETSGRYRSTADARERFEELAVREVSARAFMALAARGHYDRRAHGDPGGSRPLTVTEHLELLAATGIPRMRTGRCRRARPGRRWPRRPAATRIRRGGTTARGRRTSISSGRITTASSASTPPSTPRRSRGLTRHRSADGELVPGLRPPGPMYLGPGRALRRGMTPSPSRPTGRNHDDQPYRRQRPAHQGA